MREMRCEIAYGFACPLPHAGPPMRFQLIAFCSALVGSASDPAGKAIRCQLGNLWSFGGDSQAADALDSLQAKSGPSPFPAENSGLQHGRRGAYARGRRRESSAYESGCPWVAKSGWVRHPSG